MNLSLLLALLLFLPPQDELPVLTPGQALQGEIGDLDPVVLTPVTEKCRPEPVVGRRYLVRLSEPGEFTVSMRSLFFLTYLVLRDREGALLAEEGNGSFWTPCRLSFESTGVGAEFLLEACAVNGERGDFELSLEAGRSDELSSSEKDARILNDARERVRLIEERLGSANPAFVLALNDLALVLENQDEPRESRKCLDRAFAICEAVLGPDRPETAILLGNLGWQLIEEEQYRSEERRVGKECRSRWSPYH